MKLPRILLAAPASGSGKTLITCGLLKALKNRGLAVNAFKCGPDYIDPMFHKRALGISSGNLDTFFTEDETTRYLFGKEASGGDISVMEGVMGFYDGIGGNSTQASAYHLAKVTGTPVILIVDVKGMGLSAVALIQGFLNYRPDSGIRGVILNRVSPGFYPELKTQIEEQLPVKVLGYVPEAAEYAIESRHLGLVMPDEIEHLKEKLQGLAELLEKTLKMEELLALAGQAEDFVFQAPKLPRLEKEVTLGIARDEAFCFFYRDNLKLLEQMGAKLCFFSPLRDDRLPEGLDGMIFYGGYPELYAAKLSANESMKRSIREAVAEGMPYLAECGGFMYLHETMEDMEQNSYPMVGLIPGRAYRTGRLNRFGYITLTARKDQILGGEGASIKGHEFHFFDSTSNGESFRARRPRSKGEWDCIHGNMQGLAGFPHLYYYSNPEMVFHFLQACAKKHKSNEK